MAKVELANAPRLAGRRHGDIEAALDRIRSEVADLTLAVGAGAYVLTSAGAKKESGNRFTVEFDAARGQEEPDQEGPEDHRLSGRRGHRRDVRS